MSLTVCYVAWNDAPVIAESIRSVGAFADRFVVVDAAFLENPTPGPVQSTDGQRAVVESAVTAAGASLTYVEPNERRPQHETRDLYIAALVPSERFLILDADEILVTEYRAFRELLAVPSPDAVSFMVYSQTLMHIGQAPEITPEQYADAPVIMSAGWMPRLFLNKSGLRHRAGWEGDGMRTKYLDPVRGERSDVALVLNRHASRSFDGYQTSYVWRVATAIRP